MVQVPQPASTVCCTLTSVLFSNSRDARTVASKNIVIITGRTYAIICGFGFGGEIMYCDNVSDDLEFVTRPARRAVVRRRDGPLIHHFC